jgi:predicted ester cyclase
MAIDIQVQSRRLFEELWSKGKLALIEECLDEQYAGHDPLLGTMNRASLKQSILGYRNAFPDLKFEVNEQVVAGNVVLTRWTASGTHRGAPLAGLDATGKHATVTGLTLAEWQHGKVVRDHTEWDALGLFRQLGAQPLAQAAATPQPGIEARH